MFLDVISLLYIGFSVEFGGMLIFQGLERIFCVIVVIFDGVESCEILDFSGFARSEYRSGFGDFGVGFGDFGFLKLRCGWNR